MPGKAFSFLFRHSLIISFPLLSQAGLSVLLDLMSERLVGGLVHGLHDLLQP